jgi:AcrR family transcriptional regulator
MNQNHSSPSTRDRVIRVSADLFARHGYDGVSIRDIIRKAKVNLGAVTYHFGGKEGLFAEVLARKTEPLIEIGRRIVASRKSPDGKLREMLTAYAVHIMHDDPGLKVLFAETKEGGERLPRVAVERVMWRNRVFADIVREGIRQRLFRKCDVECLSWNFFEMLSSYILYQPLVGKAGRSGAYPKPYVRRVVKTALDVFMNGLLDRHVSKRRKRGER